MLGVLEAILCAILALAAKIIDLLVAALNGLVSLIATLIGFVLSLLPEMPDTIPPPGSGPLAFINWFIPLGPILAGCAAILTLWVFWQLFTLALRWFKAIE